MKRLSQLNRSTVVRSFKNVDTNVIGFVIPEGDKFNVEYYGIKSAHLIFYANGYASPESAVIWMLDNDYKENLEDRREILSIAV